MAKLPECLALIAPPGEEEQLATRLLRSWLEALSADGAGSRPAALAHLLRLTRASAAEDSALALGLGQALHSFFWWGEGQDAGNQLRGLDVEVAAAALELHEAAVRHGACDVAETSRDLFLARKCPARWRFVLLLGSELGLHLAGALQDFARGAEVLARTSRHAEYLATLPFFAGADVRPLAMNQNWDYFPRAAHWPIWPRTAWPDFAWFLERHATTFIAGLEGLLAEDGEARFAATARFQSGLTPRARDWSRLKLVHSGGVNEELCALPALAATCALLRQRPEIGPRCGTFLSGASLARLAPGAALKPHFGTHPRLAVHLGLRVPVGAALSVGGEEVDWEEGRAVVFDDTYAHKVRHRGLEPRFVLVAWFCHPCDLSWRTGLGAEWQEAHPLPSACGGGGPGYSHPPAPGYGDSF